MRVRRSLCKSLRVLYEIKQNINNVKLLTGRGDAINIIRLFVDHLYVASTWSTVAYLRPNIILIIIDHHCSNRPALYDRLSENSLRITVLDLDQSAVFRRHRHCAYSDCVGSLISSLITDTADADGSSFRVIVIAVIAATLSHITVNDMFVLATVVVVFGLCVPCPAFSTTGTSNGSPIEASAGRAVDDAMAFSAENSEYVFNTTMDLVINNLTDLVIDNFTGVVIDNSKKLIIGNLTKFTFDNSTQLIFDNSTAKLTGLNVCTLVKK